METETKTTHTPGPWHVDDEGLSLSHDGILVRANSGGFRIADVHNGDHPLGLRDGKANARLIASAPDLLEALRLVKATPYAINNWIDYVDAAIAKAEGS